MNRLAQSAVDHGTYLVQQGMGSRWIDVDQLTVGAAEQPIDAFGDWLEEHDAEGSFRLVEVLDEEDR